MRHPVSTLRASFQGAAPIRAPTHASGVGTQPAQSTRASRAGWPTSRQGRTRRARTAGGRFGKGGAESPSEET
jgi:hypothetical protein